MNKIIEEEFSKYQEPFVLGRVTSVHKTHYVCDVERMQYKCTVSGRFKYLSFQKSDYPVVGDYVVLNPSEYELSGIIEKVCTRYSSLDRLGVTTVSEKQILASNIDIVFVCMSMNDDFRLRKLRRFLSLAYSSDAETVILLTKSDLAKDPDSFIGLVKTIDATCKILTVSVEDEKSIFTINNLLKDKTGVFLGSSGVGKSTIINKILKEDYFETKDIRETDAQGRHTTSHRELLVLPNGGCVIDTPGIRIVDSYIVNDLESAYETVVRSAELCRFQDCTHTSEPGCNVKGSLESGDLDQEVFDSYQHTLRLNNHNKKRELTRIRNQNKRKKG